MIPPATERSAHPDRPGWAGLRVEHGDGRQASHWKDSLGLGIMDPTAAPGELLSISANDLRLFDLIGYDIAVVPEASSLTLLLIGSVLSLAGWRRK